MLIDFDTSLYVGHLCFHFIAPFVQVANPIQDMFGKAKGFIYTLISGDLVGLRHQPRPYSIGWFPAMYFILES